MSKLTTPKRRENVAQSQIIYRRRSGKLIGIGVSLLVLLVCFLISMTYGAVDFSLSQVYEALTNFDGSTDHLIIRTVRLPRSLIAMWVGAALAVAGCLMQGLTGNPLASPGILGINSGASFAVVIATFIFGSSDLKIYAGFAFLGATLTAFGVYGLGSLGRGGLKPLNLTLAGVALTAFLSSMTTGILIISQRTLDEIRFWLAGSVAGRDIELLWQVLPYLLCGLLLAFLLSKPITTLSLGEDVAKGLGQRTLWVKICAGISVILLAGASVAVAGPIGFIGLIVPHMVRFLVGLDYRWILPYAAILGAIMLLIADLVARVVARPIELPVGLMMPLLGVPFFIYLTRLQVKR